MAPPPDPPLPDLPAPIGIAVSGGPDSLALLAMAAARHPGRVRAATVDHGLRPGSAAEAAYVATLCARLAVQHDVLTVSVAGSASGSVQAAARAARYAALADWARAYDLCWVATAHHADDQAETILMRLGRGSGLAGLAGIRASRPLAPGVTLIRPLLAWRKAALERYCAAAGLEALADPSNRDPRFDRTAARALLAGRDWPDPRRFAASAAHLAEAEAALAWAAERLAAERIDGDALDPDGLPPDLLRRLVLRMLAGFGVAPRGPELARLIAALQAGRAATLGGVKARPGPKWRFAPAPPRRPR